MHSVLTAVFVLLAPAAPPTWEGPGAAMMNRKHPRAARVAERFVLVFADELVPPDVCVPAPASRGATVTLLTRPPVAWSKAALGDTENENFRCGKARTLTAPMSAGTAVKAPGAAYPLVAGFLGTPSRQGWSAAVTEAAGAAGAEIGLPVVHVRVPGGGTFVLDLGATYGFKPGPLRGMTLRSRGREVAVTVPAPGISSVISVTDVDGDGVLEWVVSSGGEKSGFHYVVLMKDGRFMDAWWRLADWGC